MLGGEKTQRTLYPPPFGTNEHLQDDADPDDFGGGLRPRLALGPGAGFYMHRGGNDVLFDDIHVALFSRYEPLAMTFNPKRMQCSAEVTGDMPATPPPGS